MNRNSIYCYFDKLSESDQAHCLRVEALSITIGKSVKNESVNFECLKIAARFHDVGKILIPNCILNKPQKLNNEERQLIMGHSIYSARFLELSGFESQVSNFALLHHENFDGSGYPLGIVGTDIPIEARIIRVADVFDALRSERVYKKTIGNMACLEQMENEIHKFDPYIMEILSEHITCDSCNLVYYDYKKEENFNEKSN